MQQVVTEYDGDVAWVYRHFPLDSLHPKARKEAEATECAAELGGNEGFWAYTNHLFDVTPSNNQLDLAELPNIAETVGLDRADFEACLNSGRYAEEVASDLDDASQAGGRGTPYSVVIGRDGQLYPINGALSIDRVRLIIDQALE
jgi:protein-disulfide isomerase